MHLKPAGLSGRRASSHVPDGLRLPPARRVAGQYCRVAGDAAAAGQRRIENTFTDHLAVLTAAIRQIPSLPVPAAGPRRRGRCQPRADQHLLSLSSWRGPGHAGSHHHPQTNHESDIMVENGHTVISNQPRPTPESSRLMSAAGSGRLLVIPDDHLLLGPTMITCDYGQAI